MRRRYRAILARLAAGSALLALVVFVPSLRAQDDFDSYKIRIDADWLYANPSGNIQGSSDRVPVDLNRDLAFNTYSTVVGKVDWKFTRKNHLYFAAGTFSQSRQTMLSRAIVFQGQTFNAGLVTQASLDSVFFAPGYQYDIIRRKRGHLGIAVQVDLFDTTGKISAAAQVTGDGAQHAAMSASGSLLAPIPVAGPEFRLYLTNSRRLFVQANVYGMYFGGYGHFVSSTGIIGLAVAKHVSLQAGYSLATDLLINNKSSSNRFGVRLTERGALAGLEISF